MIEIFSDLQDWSMHEETEEKKDVERGVQFGSFDPEHVWRIKNEIHLRIAVRMKIEELENILDDD